MSSMNKCWSLFNKEDRLRIDDLTTEQVRTILLAVASTRMRDWFACREGDVHWQALSDIPEFYEDVQSANEPPPPLTAQASASPAKASRRPLFEEAPGHTAEATLKIESIQTKERRSARRYSRRLLFKTQTGGNTFESATVDVSMSGLSLANTLPSGLGKTFRATLSLNGLDLQVVCSRVSDTQLKILEAEAWDILRQWIANW